VKRKRYTEDLEFKISDEEADDADAAGRDSPSNTSQSEQQVRFEWSGKVDATAKFKVQIWAFFLNDINPWLAQRARRNCLFTFLRNIFIHDFVYKLMICVLTQFFEISGFYLGET